MSEWKHAVYSTNVLTIDKLQTLIDINSRMHTNYSDVGALIKYILELAMRLVGCEASFLLLVYKEETTLHLMMMLGLDNIETAGLSVVMNSIGGKVVKDNKPLIINDIASDLWIDNGGAKDGGGVLYARWRRFPVYAKAVYRCYRACQ